MITLDDERKRNIGKRIKAERIAAGYTQSNFMIAMGLSPDSRQTATNWESGKRLPCLEDLLKMCEIFNCEIGYLLCEEGYEGRTRAITDVQKLTGLSPKAVENICKLKEIDNLPPHPGLLKVLNHILENIVDFSSLLAQINLYLKEINKESPRIDSFSNEISFYKDELVKKGYVVTTPKEFSRVKFEDCTEIFKKLLDKIATEQKEGEYGNNSKAR